MNELKFSIITPSFNQGEFIKDNIRSVLNQNYKNYEHIIIDGGSKDGTLSILEKFDHIRWVSEADTGQSNAINKGFKKATGDIICWVNSDDMLANGALHIVNKYFQENIHELGITGARENIDRFGKVLNIIPSRMYTFEGLLNDNNYINQMSTFFRKDVFQYINYLDETLNYAMDYDFYLRFTKIKSIPSVDMVLAKFRIHDTSKTTLSALKLLHEQQKVRARYYGKLWCPVNRKINWYIFKRNIKKLLISNP